MNTRTHMLLAVALTSTVVGLAACGGGGGGSSPTDPANPALSLTAASVVAGSQAFQGGTQSTYHQGTNAPANGTTRFEATLVRDGVPATGHDVEVTFDMPMGGGMMAGGGHGTFHLYDDGTHGDQTPGDGIYCYADDDGSYGFHHQGAHHGDYHYDFFGIRPDGGQTNHLMINIDVED